MEIPSNGNNHVVHFSDKAYKMATVIIIVVAIFGLGELVYQFSSLPQNFPMQISVSGDGKAYLKPDIALVSFGVTTQEMKSQDAVNKNNEKMNALIDAIKKLGVDQKDIQTTLYSLNPVYDYPSTVIYNVTTPNAGAAYAPANGGRVFRGYSLQQQISVKIRDFDKINAILDAGTTGGATNTSDLQFTVDNPEQARSEARAKAIETAKQKMKDLAKESGLSIGKLVNVSEGYNSYPQPMYASGLGAGGKDSTSVAPDIQPGQMEINTTVTLTYQVR